MSTLVRDVPNGDVVMVHVRVPISLSLLVLGAMAVLDIAYLSLSPTRSEALIFIASGLAAAGTILAAIYAGRALTCQIEAVQMAHEAQRKQLAMNLAARWNDPAMLLARKTCREIVNLRSKGLDEITAVLRADNKLDDVIHLLNFLEEMAIHESEMLASSSLLRDFFQEIVIQVWKTLEHWIKMYRNERGAPKMWGGIEELKSRWESDSLNPNAPAPS